MTEIFISYRREGGAPHALSISQYLEKEFGRENVFVDVDMRAGAKFPEVLARQLSECKVLLALIGPDWLSARLDDPDDWVRIEIAAALKRDITIIRVLVGGAELPKRAALPEDIRALLDHQVVTVSSAGFRNDMTGLARDIRNIPTRGSFTTRIAGLAGRKTVLAAVMLFGLIAAYLLSGSRGNLKIGNDSGSLADSNSGVSSSGSGSTMPPDIDKIIEGRWNNATGTNIQITKSEIEGWDIWLSAGGLGRIGSTSEYGANVKVSTAQFECYYFLTRLSDGSALQLQKTRGPSVCPEGRFERPSSTRYPSTPPVVEPKGSADIHNPWVALSDVGTDSDGFFDRSPGQKARPLTVGPSDVLSANRDINMRQVPAGWAQILRRGQRVRVLATRLLPVAGTWQIWAQISVIE